MPLFLFLNISFIMIQMNKKILIIEDDKKISELIRTYLEKDGYKTVVAFDGREAWEKFKQESPDLMLLDLMLPELDGISLAKKIRETSQVPIIMLTAKVDEVDKLLGLELGADDYITKPFSPRELVARVKAVIRRYQQEPLNETLSFSALRIDIPRHSVYLNDIPVSLTHTEFEILVKMASSPGRVFNRKQLLETVQDTVYEGYERTIDAHIKNLRKKIENDPAKPVFIKTVHGVGYKFEDQDEI